jgi:hypothetical protein
VEASPDPAPVIDPGRAFGTEPIRRRASAVALLAARNAWVLPRSRLRFGILALAAVRLGFAPCARRRRRSRRGRDDARERAFQRPSQVETAILTRRPTQLPTADVAVANVLLRPVETILGRLEAHEAITSGYRPVNGPDTTRGARR